MDELNRHDVPSGAILTLEGALNQEQVKHRNTFGVTTSKALAKSVVQPDREVLQDTRKRRNPATHARAAYQRGALKSAGYTEEEIKKFKDPKII